MTEFSHEVIKSKTNTEFSASSEMLQPSLSHGKMNRLAVANNGPHTHYKLFDSIIHIDIDIHSLIKNDYQRDI